MIWSSSIFHICVNWWLQPLVRLAPGKSSHYLGRKFDSIRKRQLLQRFISVSSGDKKWLRCDYRSRQKSVTDGASKVNIKQWIVLSSNLRYMVGHCHDVCKVYSYIPVFVSAIFFKKGKTLWQPAYFSGRHNRFAMASGLLGFYGSRSVCFKVHPYHRWR